MTFGSQGRDAYAYVAKENGGQGCPRRLRGLRHPLLAILVLTACAMLVIGNDSVTAIWQRAARGRGMSCTGSGPGSTRCGGRSGALGITG